MTEEDIETLLAALILTYQKNLLSGVTKSTLEAAMEATQALNKKRLEAGLEKITFKDAEITEKALKQAEDYYTKLVKDGGSEVVENEKAVFKPWLSDLKTNLKNELLLIAAIDTGLLAGALDSLQKEGERRAELAAEYETLHNAQKIKNDIWIENNVEKFVWHSRDDPATCPECFERDGHVYKWNDLPDLPAHPKCRCELEIHEVLI